MPQFVSAEEAVARIPDNAFIGVNAFLALANPLELLTALADRFEATGSPRGLTMYCSSGFGNWEEDSGCERIITRGGAECVIISHYPTMPGTAKAVMENRVAGYNFPLGALTHMIREAARGSDHYLTKSGLNLFVDPRIGGSKLNERAVEDWVSDIEIDGERYLKYKVPQFDVALLKGSSCDRFGNITMEKESCVVDALSLAQATKRNGGMVIVQVEHMAEKRRPWESIVPTALVDYIVLCPEQTPVLGADDYNPSFCGDRFMTAEEITEFVLSNKPSKTSPVRTRIAKRATDELHPGAVVNIGIGVPEGVSIEAAKRGMLARITLTVEDGAFGGMPTSGAAFGSAVAPHSICSTAQMFDFYDGGGLDICFLGALEVDREGNVNAHYSPGKLAGIGGFANITQTTRKVVFCFTFSAGGIEIEDSYGIVKITNEGRIPKIVEKVNAISFAAANAHANGQEVLYVTERCVFRLGEDGLELTEFYEGVDLQHDILDKLSFDVPVRLSE
ncbi:MAG: hypothetical protein IJ131_03815 [Eggerthellaceae bacterium]|nr:hypothetical protein [Eggerthellaceae bacterium]